MALCGEVNLPAKTICQCEDNRIRVNGKDICVPTSENAHQFFALDEDGHGMERGKLTQAIQKRLAKKDANYQTRWDLIWDDEVCQKYRRGEYGDYWLWNHAFFNADLDDLRHIANLIGAKEGK
jgi:hypothetical protein